MPWVLGDLTINVILAVPQAACALCLTVPITNVMVTKLQAAFALGSDSSHNQCYGCCIYTMITIVNR